MTTIPLWLVILIILGTVSVAILLACVLVWTAGVSVLGLLWVQSPPNREQLTRLFKMRLDERDSHWAWRKFSVIRLLQIYEGLSVESRGWRARRVQKEIREALQDAFGHESDPRVRNEIQDALERLGLRPESS